MKQMKRYSQGYYGFRRKFIWLFVSTTNNDLLLVANLYLRAITKLAEHQIHCECIWVQKIFIVKNFMYFLLKTVTSFCTLHRPETRE